MAARHFVASNLLCSVYEDACDTGFGGILLVFTIVNSNTYNFHGLLMLALSRTASRAGGPGSYGVDPWGRIAMGADHGQGT